jgi:hypothetical protein
LKAEVSWVVKVWNSDKKLIYGENDLIWFNKEMNNCKFSFSHQKIGKVNIIPSADVSTLKTHTLSKPQMQTQFWCWVQWGNIIV